MSSTQQQTRPAQSSSNRGNNRGRQGRRINSSGRPNVANPNEDYRPPKAGEPSIQQASHPQSSRARKFGGQLSTSTATAPLVSENGPNRQKASNVQGTATRIRLDDVNIPDLTAKLMETLKAPPYAECVICFAPIIPQQSVWTCTVSEETNRCCWGVFHSKCIASWSEKSECSP